MKTDNIKLFMKIIYSVVTDVRLTEQEESLCSKELQGQFVRLAQKHDITHLLVVGLKNNNLLGDNAGKADDEILKAVFRCESQDYELRIISEALEKAKIPFMPLKGAVIRAFYPESWMRTSCDIDILIHEEDLDRATDVLTGQCNYKFETKGSHDLSFYTGSNVHIELHYDLIENERANDATAVLTNIWNEAVLKEGTDFHYCMPDELFYFYHIAHMAKHFVNGGCGVRPFVDLWILNHRVTYDRDKRVELLKKGDLITFAKQAEMLSEAWSGNGEYIDVTRQMESYIINGGVYGSMENRVVVQQQKRGGKLGYAMSRIFISYDILKFQYPILEKHRWLMPFMEVYRWGRLLCGGRVRRSMNELNYNRNISSATVQATEQLLKDIGL